MSEAANVPDRLFVVQNRESELAFIAFWRKEGAFGWIQAQAAPGAWQVAEVPIYPAFPSGPWHAQVPVEAAEEPSDIPDFRSVHGILRGKAPPRATGADGDEPALAARAREGGAP